MFSDVSVSLDSTWPYGKRTKWEVNGQDGTAKNSRSLRLFLQWQENIYKSKYAGYSKWIFSDIINGKYRCLFFHILVLCFKTCRLLILFINMNKLLRRKKQD